jgi:hypothetical protein
MATFTPGVDSEVRSDEPLLEVKASASMPLPAGRHIFQLVVTDNAGNQSAPSSIRISVQDRIKPTAEIDFIREDGTRVYDDDIVVAYGKPFRLTGERSSDTSGAVKMWQWTLISS